MNKIASIFSVSIFERSLLRRFSISSEENTDNETKEAMSIFDHVIESSIVGIRKPNPEIYMMSCDALNVSPDQCIYLDDLGINLKPARELGMTTIKVIQPEDAIQEVRNLLK